MNKKTEEETNKKYKRVIVKDVFIVVMLVITAFFIGMAVQGHIDFLQAQAIAQKMAQDANVVIG